MFVRWGWVRSANLTLEVVQQLDRLSKCNRSLYDEPTRLASLPGEEVLQYFGPNPNPNPNPNLTLTLTLTLTRCSSTSAAAGTASGAAL